MRPRPVLCTDSSPKRAGFTAPRAQTVRKNMPSKRLYFNDILSAFFPHTHIMQFPFCTLIPRNFIFYFSGGLFYKSYRWVLYKYMHFIDVKSEAK